MDLTQICNTESFQPLNQNSASTVVDPSWTNAKQSSTAITVEPTSVGGSSLWVLMNTSSLTVRTMELLRQTRTLPSPEDSAMWMTRFTLTLSVGRWFREWVQPKVEGSTF